MIQIGLVFCLSAVAEIFVSFQQNTHCVSDIELSISIT